MNLPAETPPFIGSVRAICILWAAAMHAVDDTHCIALKVITDILPPRYYVYRMVLCGCNVATGALPSAYACLHYSRRWPDLSIGNLVLGSKTPFEHCKRPCCSFPHGHCWCQHQALEEPN